MSLRLGELCAGYGGLGMAVEEVFGAETAWFSEFDAAPSKILAHHWPDVPNHGDMTKIDWANIEPADIISGGTPCQDLSAAGRRAGMNEGTRSNLWVQMREAIAIQRPKWVVWENVRGAFSAEASCDLEQCTGCVGDTSDGRVFLRALGRVLGDLSDLGYDIQWRGLRASDVGAPHARFRVFVLARRIAYANSQGLEVGGASRVSPLEDAGPAVIGNHAHASDPDRCASGRRPDLGGSGGRQIEVQDTADAYRLGYQRGWEARGWRLGLADGGGAAPDSESIRWGEGWAESEGIQRGLAAACDSSPTSDAGSAGERREATPDAIGSGRVGWPREAGREEGGGATSERPGEGVAWGEYELAIRRWERTTGRRAPRPTEPTGRNSGERLSPRFTEWMMGLPDGWVTDPAIGISRNEQLKACGNGVVPQQAMAALRDMLAAFKQQGRQVA